MKICLAKWNQANTKLYSQTYSNDHLFKKTSAESTQANSHLA